MDSITSLANLTTCSDSTEGEISNVKVFAKNGQ